MEEATITSTEQLSNKSMIVMDDFFIQIGKLHIDKLNSDKMLEALYKQFEEYKKQTEIKIAELSKVSSVAEGKITTANLRLKKVEESNKQYQANNQKLADKIDELSQEISKRETTIDLLNQEISELKTKKRKTTKRVTKTSK
jgi:chromosome segregation ATPase